MAKGKTPATPVAPKEEPRTPVTNQDRMSALEEQKSNLEASYQKVLGAMELLTAIIEEEKNAK
tara:strand:+ start:275 stop:463 length:189 start_codon:yes stop_codon:yes gene_type:complete